MHCTALYCTVTMQKGAFVLKIKTRNWRMCVVKQVPELAASSWMMFGESMSQGTNQCTTQCMKTTFQLEFKPYQETTLIHHIVDMAEANMEVQFRMVLVTESPTISCIRSLWALKGLEMYRRELDTDKSLVNSLHQDMNMLNLSPQVFKHEQQSQQSRHSMQTRSKTLN
jgi:hypothetical protein